MFRKTGARPGVPCVGMAGHQQFGHERALPEPVQALLRRRRLIDDSWHHCLQVAEMCANHVSISKYSFVGFLCVVLSRGCSSLETISHHQGMTPQSSKSPAVVLSVIKSETCITLYGLSDIIVLCAKVVKKEEAADYVMYRDSERLRGTCGNCSDFNFLTPKPRAARVGLLEK